MSNGTLIGAIALVSLGLSFSLGVGIQANLAPASPFWACWLFGALLAVTFLIGWVKLFAASGSVPEVMTLWFCIAILTTILIPALIWGHQHAERVQYERQHRVHHK